MAASHSRIKAGLAIGAGTAVIWGSLYFSSNQSAASSPTPSAETTTSTSTTLGAPSQPNTTKQTASPSNVRRTRRS